MYARSRVSPAVCRSLGQLVLHRYYCFTRYSRVSQARVSTPLRLFDCYTSLNVRRARFFPNFRIYLRRLFIKKKNNILSLWPICDIAFFKKKKTALFFRLYSHSSLGITEYVEYTRFPRITPILRTEYSWSKTSSQSSLILDFGHSLLIVHSVVSNSHCLLPILRPIFGRKDHF